MGQVAPVRSRAVPSGSVLRSRVGAQEGTRADETNHPPGLIHATCATGQCARGNRSLAGARGTRYAQGRHRPFGGARAVGSTRAWPLRTGGLLAGGASWTCTGRGLGPDGGGVPAVGPPVSQADDPGALSGGTGVVQRRFNRKRSGEERRSGERGIDYLRHSLPTTPPPRSLPNDAPRGRVTKYRVRRADLDTFVAATQRPPASPEVGIASETVGTSAGLLSHRQGDQAAFRSTSSRVPSAAATRSSMSSVGL